LSVTTSQQGIVDAERLIAWFRERIQRAIQAEQAMRRSRRTFLQVAGPKLQAPTLLAGFDSLR